jgi:hypothetical protein
MERVGAINACGQQRRQQVGPQRLLPPAGGPGYLPLVLPGERAGQRRLESQLGNEPLEEQRF